MVRISLLLLIIGYLLNFLGVALAAPLIVEYFSNSNAENWQAFAVTEFIVIFIGVSLSISCKNENIKSISIKETFLVTNIAWLTLALFSSLPFYILDLNLSYTDAFFEAVSGLTTTGATILTNLDNAPKGILVWRAILEWFGGIGIIVMAMAIFPFLSIGGMQLFRTESSDKNEKIIPRAKKFCIIISIIYLCLTIICGLLLYFAGMTVFDAILHSMTTVSTGGFSTHDNSIAFFDSYKIEIIIAFFILISSIPFVTHIQLLTGKHISALKDQQVLFFFITLAIAITIGTVWLNNNLNFSLAQSFRYALFNITAIFTTTGFSSIDYGAWGGFFTTFVFLICIIGGCTGSTTGGIKIFRFQILYYMVKIQIFKLIHPHGVYKINYNNNIISNNVFDAVSSFFILFCLSFFLIALMLSLSGLDFITSLSGAAASIANVGPALGEIIGPNGNYSTLNDFSKWILSFGMLLGRLEIVTIIVLFSKQFWNN